jgi:hypothetical protein
MTTQRKGAVLTAVVAIAFFALALGFGVRTLEAGLFVAGMSGGLLIGEATASPYRCFPEYSSIWEARSSG